jgi:hypothetical protein
MRPAMLALSLLAAGCLGPSERDVFIPPYAEKGCWVRFYEQPDFGLPMRQLEGPSFVEAIPRTTITVPDQAQAGTQPLFSEVRSLVVGPHARVIGYAGKLFRGEATVLHPGTVAADAQSIGYAGFESLTVECQAARRG